MKFPHSWLDACARMGIIPRMPRPLCAQLAALCFTAALVTSCGGNPPPRRQPSPPSYPQVEQPGSTSSIPPTPPPPVAGESAIVIENEDDLHKVNLNKPIRLFSQTTKSLDGYNHLISTISEIKNKEVTFEYTDTICRQVANRMPNITIFAQQNDIIIFVGGKKSSNAKVLFEHCREQNPNTYFVAEPEEVEDLNLDLNKKIGICGATSTPRWVMEAVQNKLKELAEKQGIK